MSASQSEDSSVPKFENSPSDPPKRKRGRPPGSKNRSPVADIAMVPGGCPVCESTERRVIKILRVRLINGVRNGQAFNQVTWRRCECLKCSQIIVTREYRNL